MAAAAGPARLCFGLVLWFCLLASGPADDSADEPIPDKVGVEVHLSKKERGALKKVECQMCKAIMIEMYDEVVKHDMTAGGEARIWETSNAICIALLQKWRLDLSKPSLERKAEDEEDDVAMAQSGDPAGFMRGLMVLKMGCSRWVEDYGSETSGYVYKAVKDRTESSSAQAAAKDFCANTVSLCGKGSKEKRQQEKEKERARLKERAEKLKVQEEKLSKDKEKDPFAGLPEESQFGLQKLLQQAKDDPFAYMDDDAKKKVTKARADLRCDVCKAVLSDVHSAVQKKPKTMRTETDILPLVEGACEGGKDLSVPAYFGIEPPPLPPVWTDRVRPHLTKKTKRWALRAFTSKKAEKARQKWRKKAATGEAKPPAGDESEEDMMMTLACKDTLDAARMTEALYAQMQGCDDEPVPGAPRCDPAAASARLVCKDADDRPCSYRTSEDGSGEQTSGKAEEL